MGKSLRTQEKNNLHTLHTFFEKEQKNSRGHREARASAP